MITYYLTDPVGGSILALGPAPWLRERLSDDITADSLYELIFFCGPSENQSQYEASRDLVAAWIVKVANRRTCRLVHTGCLNEGLEGFWNSFHTMTPDISWDSWQDLWPLEEDDGSLTLSSGRMIDGARLLLEPDEILRDLTGKSELQAHERRELAGAVIAAWHKWSRGTW